MAVYEIFIKESVWKDLKIVPKKDLTKIIGIACGDWQSLALHKDGKLYAWGWNNDGQLGTGEWIDANQPDRVKNLGNKGFLRNVISIDGGREFSIALLSNGQIRSWGENRFGQLGNGMTENTTLPVEVKDTDGINNLDKWGPC